MTPEARRILVEAKGLVARGWFQGTGDPAKFVGVAPYHCVETALEARAVTRGFAEAEEALYDALGLCSEHRAPSHVFAWNDAPGRTHEEVVALFDRALLEDALPERGKSAGASEGNMSARFQQPRSESAEAPA